MGIPSGDNRIPKKVKPLMASIADIGLQKPIDVLEVAGEYSGFSGGHCYEACCNLVHDTIRARRLPRPQISA